MHKILMIIMAAACLVGCSDPKMEKVDQLKSETIAIHDEVMPRMGEISELTMELKDLRAAVSADTDSSIVMQRKIWSVQILALDSAHEAMMSWMADYDPSYTSSHPVDSAIVYYEEQRKFIGDVKTLMAKSIEDAKILVEQSK